METPCRDGVQLNAAEPLSVLSSRRARTVDRQRLTGLQCTEIRSSTGVVERQYHLICTALGLMLLRVPANVTFVDPVES